MSNAAVAARTCPVYAYLPPGSAVSFSGAMDVPLGFGIFGERDEGLQPLRREADLVIVLAQGVLIAPPRPVRGVVNILGQLASGVTQARRWASAHAPAGQCSSVRTADHGPGGGGVVAARRRRWRLKKHTRGQLQV
jgi:hypothetical protein